MFTDNEIKVIAKTIAELSGHEIREAVIRTALEKAEGMREHREYDERMGRDIY